MEQFSIEIADSKRQSIWGLPSCIGQITINDLKETFVMPLDWWYQKDYKQQWLKGLERIFTHERSCLIISIQHLYIRPHISWWILYKEGTTVFLQHHYIFSTLFQRRIGHRSFNAKTCYRHILPRRSYTIEGEKISEWRVSLEAVQKFLNQLQQSSKPRRIKTISKKKLRANAMKKSNYT